MCGAHLSRSNSKDPADIERKLVPCVQLLTCVYICSVLVQQCVNFFSIVVCTLIIIYTIPYRCAYICSVQLCVYLQRCTRPYSSLKIHKSIVGTSPRYWFIVTTEPSIRQIKFFDTRSKLQIFESLNFVRKIINSQIETSKNIRRL